jgi:hypothetical protein
LYTRGQKGLSFISNRQRRKEGTVCVSELAGIEPTPDIIIDVGVRSDCVVLHVLKHAELVKDVDAELVDEGIFVFVLEQWHRITGDSIGGGIFVVVENCACVQT